MMRFMIPLMTVLALPSTLSGAIQQELEVGGIMNNTLATAEPILNANFTLPVPATVFDPPGWATATIVGSGGLTIDIPDPSLPVFRFRRDVDVYSFTTTMAGGAMFDIDSEPNPPFGNLNLFDSFGTLIGRSVRSDPADAGSHFSGNDAFLGIINLEPGTYYVAVTGVRPLGLPTFPTFPQTQKLTRPDGGEGGMEIFNAVFGESRFSESSIHGPSPYTLHISLESPVGRGGGNVPEPMSLIVWTLLGMTAARARRCCGRSVRAD
jgi:hypothetical protein